MNSQCHMTLSEQGYSLDETVRGYSHSLGEAPERDLLDAILHEVRQPLVAIELFSMQGRMLSQGRQQKSARIRALFNEIGSGVNLATNIIDRLRRLSGGLVPGAETIDLNEAVADTLRLAEIVAMSQDVLLRAELASGLQPLRADRVSLQQALLDLVLNGIEAVRGCAEAEVTVSTAFGDAKHSIYVTDNGPGIPDDCLERIFEPGFTTKSESRGLGLAIARSVIEANGGTLLAERSTSGCGARFGIHLPAAAAPDGRNG